MTTPEVVVVGGGLAGLTAALACADGGARVELLEAGPRLGGLAGSFRRDGLWIDNGQHVFLRCCSAYRWLLRRLGVERRVTLQHRLDLPVVGADGRVARLRRTGLPAPFHLAASLAGYRHLSVGDRLRAARACWRLRGLELADGHLDERTFGSWLHEAGQSAAAVAALWDLIGVATLNARADDASLWLAAMAFKTGLLTHADAADIGHADVPLARVHAEPAEQALAAAGAAVRTRVAVRRVEPAGEGRLDVRADARHVEADAVVLAVPHDRLPALLPAGALPDPAALARLGVSPILNAHVVYDRPVTRLGFAAVLGGPLQWVFDRTRAAGLDQGQYLALSVSAADRLIDLRVADLRALLVPALARAFPAARQATVTSFLVTRERAATFRQAPGTRALRPGPRTGVPGLYLAGAWTDTGWPATMEGAVRSGLAAARQALADQGLGGRLPAPEGSPEVAA